MEQLPEKQWCTDHNVNFYLRDGQYGKFYSHKEASDPKGYHNAKPESFGYTILEDIDKWEPRSKVAEPAREPIKQRDFDAEARGKTRCQVAVAFIAAGVKTPSDDIVEVMEDWVDYVMNGKS